MHTFGQASAIVHYTWIIFFVEIGYSYGYLLANEIREAYVTLLSSLVGDKWYDKVREAILVNISEQ